MVHWEFIVLGDYWHLLSEYIYIYFFFHINALLMWCCVVLGSSKVNKCWFVKKNNRL